MKIKTIIIAAAIIATTGAMTDASAQLTKSMISSHDGGHHGRPTPTKPHPQNRNSFTWVSFDRFTKVLTVHLSKDSQDGKIEINSSQSGKTTIMIHPGETVNYNLKIYGSSNYTILVSSGNTVIYSNNINNR